MVISAYVEAAFQQVVAQIERAIMAVDRALIERRSHLLNFASVLILSAVYFEIPYATLPYAFLLLCVMIAIKRRLIGYPRRGVALIVLGFCVGTFFSGPLGIILVDCGTAPFNAAIVRVYSRHTRLVLGLTLMVLVVQVILNHPAGKMVTNEAAAQLVACSVYCVRTRMLME